MHKWSLFDEEHNVSLSARTLSTFSHVELVAVQSAEARRVWLESHLAVQLGKSMRILVLDYLGRDEDWTVIHGMVAYGGGTGTRPRGALGIYIYVYVFCFNPPPGGTNHS